MNLIELQRYTISEEKSEEYLQAQGILQGENDEEIIVEIPQNISE